MKAYKRKPRKCPECGSSKVARILYGMPAYSEKLIKDQEEGKIVLGGCCISEDDPYWRCIDCSNNIYKNISWTGWVDLKTTPYSHPNDIREEILFVSALDDSQQKRDALKTLNEYLVHAEAIPH